MQLPRQRIQENVEGGDEMGVKGKGSQEDDLSQLQARSKRVKGLFHGFDGHLDGQQEKIDDDKTYQGPSPCNMSTSGSYTSQIDAPKAAITNLFDDLEAVLETDGARRRRRSMGIVVGDGHDVEQSAADLDA